MSIWQLKAEGKSVKQIAVINKTQSGIYKILTKDNIHSKKQTDILD